MKRAIAEEKKRRQKEAEEESEEEIESDEEDEEEDEEAMNDFRKTPEAVDKYKIAAEIANKTLAAVVKKVVPGAKVLELAQFGDNMIETEVKTKFTKSKRMEKGVAFPTCISINNCVGHYSPLGNDTLAISEGDVVKIDLAAHIDGYIASVAHTVVATATPAEPATGKKADVICAAHFAAEAALRLLRPGNKNSEVTEAIAKVAETFKVNPVEGVLSHLIRRFVIDGDKVIINKSTVEQKVDEFTFEEGEVYTVDIVMSTGEGKAKEVESRTTIFKRAPEGAYNLKLKASRYVMSEINKKFPVLPFTLRSLDEKQGKMGIIECLKHDLVHPYPVLYEKPGEYVAQIKFTVLLLPSSISKITTHEAPFVKSEYSIVDEKLKHILSLGTKRTSQAKKNKKKKKAGAKAPALVPAAEGAAPAASEAAPTTPAN